MHGNLQRVKSYKSVSRTGPVHCKTFGGQTEAVGTGAGADGRADGNTGVAAGAAREERPGLQ